MDMDPVFTRRQIPEVELDLHRHLDLFKGGHTHARALSVFDLDLDRLGVLCAGHRRREHHPRHYCNGLVHKRGTDAHLAQPLESEANSGETCRVTILSSLRLGLSRDRAVALHCLPYLDGLFRGQHLAGPAKLP